MAKLYISFHLSNALFVLFPVHDWYLAQTRVISIMHVCIVCNLYLCGVCGSWKNSMWISFIHGMKYNNVKLTYNICEDKLWEALLHIWQIRVAIIGGSSPQEWCISSVFFLTPQTSVLKENSGGELTDFFDFFLTKENRKRDVKEC